MHFSHLIKEKMPVRNIPNPLSQKKKPWHAHFSSTSEHYGNTCILKRCRMEMPSHHLTSRHAGLWFGACGQEHFLPTNATAVELMRNYLLKTVKLRVCVALPQHASFVSSVMKVILSGSSSFICLFTVIHTVIIICYCLFSQEPLAASWRSTFASTNVNMKHVSIKMNVAERFFFKHWGPTEVGWGEKTSRSLVELQTEKQVKMWHEQKSFDVDLLVSASRASGDPAKRAKLGNWQVIREKSHKLIRAGNAPGLQK